MEMLSPRRDFIIVKDFFSPEQAAEWLNFFLKKGEDSVRGFHSPLLRPNRFHKAPRYPVKKYMCFGFYWNPMDYIYYSKIPENEVAPFPVPQEIKNFANEVLNRFYQREGFSPEGIIVNFYTKDSSMGLHVDKDEEDHLSPVIGMNFGSSCRFFFEDEDGEIKDTVIPGNSLYIFGRTARLMKHGLGSIYAKTLSLGSEGYLENKERLNVTIRQIFSN